MFKEMRVWWYSGISLERLSVYKIEERVLVIKTETLYSAGPFQGLITDIGKYMCIINDLRNIEYKERMYVETDPSYKQIIPYVIFASDSKVFSYLRGKLTKEKRLEGKYSIGIGGHIATNDRHLYCEPYIKGMLREVEEEVEVNSVYTDHIVGLLNDDSNDVGKVHFGIVHLFLLQTPNIKAKEKSINRSGFLSISELKMNIANYESWSRICIENIEDLLRIVGENRRAD